MAYFVFQKNSDNVENTLYRIAANENDLNNLSITQSQYKIIQDNDNNFNSVKYNTKQALKYNQNTITYIDLSINFLNKEDLDNYIKNVIVSIKCFLDNNPNHPLFTQWNNYCNQLKTFKTSTITYPLNKSLEQYFNDLSQISFNTLQLP
jgi:hypothetical protein